MNNARWTPGKRAFLFFPVTGYFDLGLGEYSIARHRIDFRLLKDVLHC